MALSVLQPGPLCTVQDGGRHGWQHLGLGPSGALDPWSLAQGNLLVGNPAGAAALEIHHGGVQLGIERDALLVISGAQAEAWIGKHPWPPLAPALLRAGTEIRIGRLRRGARAYLCVDGGIATEPVLGSRSAHLAAGIGAPLRSGERLALGEPAPLRYPGLVARWRASSDGVAVASWWAEGLWARWRTGRLRLRVLRGPAWAQLDGASRALLRRGDFRIGASADRMGARLEGPELKFSAPPEAGSSPVTAGTLQLPPNGQLIVLLAERQTLGGYPRIGEVISADLPLLAQLRAGEPFAFQPVDAEQAQRALRQRVQLLWRLGVGLHARMER